MSLQAGVKLPSAPKTVGTGRTDYLLQGIHSLAIGRFNFDLNILYTRLGEKSENEGRNQLGWVTTTSYAVTDRLSIAGEFFGTHREGVRPFLQYLSAVSYAITPRLVADTGVAFGLTGESQDWTLFTD